MTRININHRYPYSQVVGSVIFQAAGLIAPDATSVQVRVNGVDRAVSDRLMHGSYVHVEVAAAELARAADLEGVDALHGRGVEHALRGAVPALHALLRVDLPDRFGWLNIHPDGTIVGTASGIHRK